MKKIKALIVDIVKIIINCIMVPLYFIKLFCDKAVLPGVNENGETIVNISYYHYSIFYKIDRAGISFLLWIAIATIIVSIVLSVLSMVMKDKKALKIASYIVFGVTVILFFVLLFIAWTISYKY